MQTVGRDDKTKRLLTGDPSDLVSERTPTSCAPFEAWRKSQLERWESEFEGEEDGRRKGV